MVLKKFFNLVRSFFNHMNQPLHIEFVLSDYCNLNCKGCTHYSPIAPKEFISINVLKDNISHLSKVIGNSIKDFYIIGGEPLLVPNLIDAMALVRTYFPNGKISIFTNGLVLPKMSVEFWNKCRQYNIYIVITRYPVKFDYDAVIDLCRRYNVNCEVFGDRSKDNSFFRFGLDETKSQNKRISHFKCYNRGCISVVGDKIFPCSISACVDHLNKRFGTSFSHESSDFIYVKDVKNISQIRKLRDRPVPFCSYCIVPPSAVEYGPSRREKSEWVD